MTFNSENACRFPLQVWNVFPKGMFIDNIVEVAKKELAWEVDYVREAECTRKFKTLLAPFPEYFVPDVIGDILVTYFWL